MVVAFVQGALGGLGFLIFGLPQPAFWGTVMVPAAVIPLAGSAIIWGPAAAYLLLTGQVGAGVGLILWGRGAGEPHRQRAQTFAGKGSRSTPSIFILFSILGGITYFGMIASSWAP